MRVPVVLAVSWLVGCTASSAGTSPGTVAPGTVPLEERPLLVVRGEASADVDPDTAKLYLRVERMAADARAATEAVLKRVQAVTAAVREAASGADVSTQELKVKATKTSRPERTPGSFTARTVGYRGVGGVELDGVEPAAATAIVVAAFAAGATDVAVDLRRERCDAELGELRAQAVERARARAAAAAEAAGTRLGALYRLKETFSHCKGTATPLRIVLEASDDDFSDPPLLDASALIGVPWRARPHPRVEVEMVYALAGMPTAPAGEAPGEIHMGLSHAASIASDSVEAQLSFVVRATGSDATALLADVSQRLAATYELLTGAGVTDDEIRRVDLDLGSEEEDVDEEGHAIRRRHHFEVEGALVLESKRHERLGAWIAKAGEGGIDRAHGPTWSLVDAEALRLEALRKAMAEAVEATRELAGHADREPRGLTQVRLDGAWLHEEDPLYRFLYGHPIRPTGGGGFRTAAVPKPLPKIDVLPKRQRATASVALGFALAPVAN